MEIERKWNNLRSLLAEMNGAVLAYSGGVDSSLLLKAASDVLHDRLIAVLAISETYPPTELQPATAFADSQGVTLQVLHTTELESGEFARNTPDRCYHCKKELFAKLFEVAASNGLRHVLDGSNTDDLNDHRPGRRAAAEFGVRSPLVEADFSKQDIRECSRRLGLPTWNKPSLACLSSRIPYGTRITREALRVIQSAEEYLHGLGFRQVRVRHHGDLARIELDPADFPRLRVNGATEHITKALKALGYRYVCLDLEGYRTGSMNEGLDRPLKVTIVKEGVKA